MVKYIDECACIVNDIPRNDTKNSRSHSAGSTHAQSHTHTCGIFSILTYALVCTACVEGSTAVKHAYMLTHMQACTHTYISQSLKDHSTIQMKSKLMKSRNILHTIKPQLINSKLKKKSYEMENCVLCGLVWVSSFIRILWCGTSFKRSLWKNEKQAN